MDDTVYYCTKCERKLDSKKIVWLELNNENGQYYYHLKDNHIPENESQGLFPFGRDCAYNIGNIWKR